MKRQNKLYLLSLSLIFVLSGCVVRTYKVTKDRVDQDLSAGNRGYLKGGAPASEGGERKSTRTTRVVEIELRSPVKFEKTKKEGPQQAAATKEAETEEPEQVSATEYVTKTESNAVSFEKYTVQKNDTLQKISQRFYGTTKKWLKIYEANKDILKGPNKVYPGQVLNIPSLPEPGLKEPKEKIK